jgi:hypothetical protein
METEQKTVKILVDEVTQKEVEVALPYYSKTICHNYKVVSDKICIQVCRSFSGDSIQSINASHGLNPKNEISNEQEFEDAYADALVKLHETKITI